MNANTISIQAIRSRLMKDTHGGFVEEIIIIGVVCLLSIAAFTIFGKDIQDKIQKEGTAVLNVSQ